MKLSIRRGFTLTEIMIAMVMLAVVGAAATKLLANQTRSYDLEANIRNARSISRSATNVLVSDLRMVQDSGGVDSVLSDGKLIRILVPYRFGMVCATTGTTTTVTLLPSDSSAVSMSAYTGFAYRGANGRYVYVWPSNPTTSGAPVAAATPALCTGNGAGQAQIVTVSVNGRTGSILDLPGPAATGAAAGTPVFLFQRITYSFRASGIYANSIGLWRDVENGRNEELMAPFDTSARFRYYQAGDDTSRTNPPAISDIRGIDLNLIAMSARATSTNPSASRSKMVTSVFFKNVRAF